MIETVTVLSPLHCLYLAGVVVILTVMIMRKDTPAVCIGFLFLLEALLEESRLFSMRCSMQQKSLWRSLLQLPW